MSNNHLYKCAPDRCCTHRPGTCFTDPEQEGHVKPIRSYARWLPWVGGLFAVLFLGSVWSAKAHDYKLNGSWVYASWIQKNPKYRKNGVHCCSERDCRPLKAGELYFTPFGWKVRGWEGALSPDLLGEADSGIFRTPSGIKQAWACYGYTYIGGRVRQKLRCLFVRDSGQ